MGHCPSGGQVFFGRGTAALAAVGEAWPDRAMELGVTFAQASGMTRDSAAASTVQCNALPVAPQVRRLNGRFELESCAVRAWRFGLRFL